MKKIFKLGIAALLLAFVFTAISSITSAKANASNGSLSADLDGDGTKEEVAWEFDEEDRIVTSLTINGKDVYKATKTEPLYTPYEFEVKVVDTATKDKYKDLVVELSEDTKWFAIFRYDNGKITKYVDEETLTGSEIVSQKKKGVVKVSDYILVDNIGNIFTDMSYKVKSGKAKFDKKQTFVPNKSNSTTTFKATEGMMVYKKDNCKTVKGELKLGETFKILKFKYDKSGDLCLVYIKTKSGVKGWINTKEFEGDEENRWLVEEPPLFG
ncbi:MAG: hypothetical protein K6G45_08920 [Lachnospiraceae bacterium]|nr:hypothetical protein [Lachnospiraceae bacterium]